MRYPVHKTRFLVVVCAVAYVVFAAPACSVSGNKHLGGIWHTDETYVSGQMVAMEFKLENSFFGNEWSGRWEMMEVLRKGDIHRVKVTDSEIEVVMSDNWTFKGELSSNGETLDARRNALEGPGGIRTLTGCS